MENRFNLIDEPWIPIIDNGLVSLRQLFEHPEYTSLGGNPVQKIAMFKLLLAIMQAANTPKDNDEWLSLGTKGMANSCLLYLQKWHSKFYLYGDEPFLQMPQVNNAKIQSFGALQPEIATGNTTLLTENQVENPLNDAQKALLLITLMGFALGGKKTDNRVVLTAGYQGKSNEKGKPASGKFGPSLDFKGLLHSFCFTKSLLESLWLNQITQQTLADFNLYSAGVGTAPWEAMPIGEDCEIARTYKNSLMGRLVPLCRFCLLNEQGLHNTEGIRHTNYKDGMFDLSIASRKQGKEIKVLWVNTERRPWRELTALLMFINQTRLQESFFCYQIEFAISRLPVSVNTFAIWNGGLKVSSNAGEQYTTGIDDYLESMIWLSRDQLNERWFTTLQQGMAELEKINKQLFACTSGFFKSQNMEPESAKDRASQACGLYWQICENQFQSLVNACEDGEENIAIRQQLRQGFAREAEEIYNQFCQQSTARQLDAWAKNRPNFSQYFI